MFKYVYSLLGNTHEYYWILSYFSTFDPMSIRPYVLRPFVEPPSIIDISGFNLFLRYIQIWASRSYLMLSKNILFLLRCTKNWICIEKVIKYVSTQNFQKEKKKESPLKMIKWILVANWSWKVEMGNKPPKQYERNSISQRFWR